jgi:hypothetical protein
MAANVSKRLLPVESFLAKLFNEATEDLDLWAAGLVLSKEGFGSLLFNPMEAAEYRDVVSALMKTYASDQLLSRRAVEAELRDAIFSAFGGPQAKKDGFKSRLVTALGKLDSGLTRDPTSYSVFVPVAGASLDGLPFTFGKIRLVRFNDSQLRKFRSATRAHKIGEAELRRRLTVISQLRSRELWDQPCAVVQVKARDSNAAYEIARREAQDALDALNFFADLTAYQHGRLYLPGVRDSRPIVTPVLAETGSWTLPHTRAGPIAFYDFDKLRQATELAPVVRRVHRIARSEGIHEVEDVLLTAVRWAGRAAIEVRKEHEFLLYAIALESAVLPGGNTEQLSYRLRLRVAHLLGRRPEKRKDLVRQVRDLYKIRSKIVHSGWYQVSEEDLDRMRRTCKLVLLRLLTHKSIGQLKSLAELEAWFEARVLR